MAPRYEDYGTFFQANGAIAGAAGDYAAASLFNWLDDAKANVISGKSVEPFKFFLKTGVLGETISSIVQAVEVRIDSSGTISLAFNSSSISAGNILTDAGAELLIGASVIAFFPALTVFPILTAVGAGLAWSGIKWASGTIYDIIYDTQDVKLQLLNNSGQHIASLFYEKGSGYPTNPAEAAQELLSNYPHISSIIGYKIVTNGGRDNGKEFKISDTPYIKIAEQLGISTDNLMSNATHEMDNARYSATNAAIGKVYFYPTNSKLDLLVPVNNAAQLVAVDNIYSGSIKLAGSDYSASAGINLILGSNSIDNLNGANGNDLLLGGIGNDTLNGGLGNDIIDGALERTQ